MKLNKVIIILLAFVIGSALALAANPEQVKAAILYSCACPPSGGQQGIAPESDTFLETPTSTTASPTLPTAGNDLEGAKEKTVKPDEAFYVQLLKKIEIFLKNLAK